MKKTQNSSEEFSLKDLIEKDNSAFQRIARIEHFPLKEPVEFMTLHSEWQLQPECAGEVSIAPFSNQ
jgi:hypothetical protein